MALKVRRYQPDETESPEDSGAESEVIDTQPAVAVESETDLETELADELADEEEEDAEPAVDKDGSDDSDDSDDSDKPEQPEKSGDLLTDIYQAEQR